MHVLDTATFEVDRDPVSDLRTIEAELAAYEGDLGEIEGYVPLMQRPRVIALNKIDIPDGKDLAEITKPELEVFGWPIFEVSAVSHEGLKEFSFALARLVEEHRAHLPALEAARTVLRPRPVGSKDEITVRVVEHAGETVYQVRGSSCWRYRRYWNPSRRRHFRLGAYLDDRS